MNRRPHQRRNDVKISINDPDDLTVAGLIEALQLMPPDARVRRIMTAEFGTTSIERIEEVDDTVVID